MGNESIKRKSVRKNIKSFQDEFEMINFSIPHNFRKKTILVGEENNADRNLVFNRDFQWKR